MTGCYNSALYRGTVMHHRLHPRRHRFAYRVHAFLFDVDELDKLPSKLALFSLNRFNLFSLHFRDFGDGSGAHPRAYLEALLREHGLAQPLARAHMLCYPRLLGYAFNPLTVYYCYNARDEVFAVLYEVRNTFGERHSYLIPAQEPAAPGSLIRQQCRKNFYVSPFNDLDQQYRFRLSVPGPSLLVAIGQREPQRPILHAQFCAQRLPLNDRQLLRAFLAMPLMTVKVVAAIHWEALRLWLKGLRLKPRPAPPLAPVSLSLPRR